MRRHSPSRSMRHQAPPKRQARGRSVSPLSRRQPSPPGEERPPRRQPPWESQERNNKRLRTRSRSRPREWTERLKDVVGPSFVRDRPPKGNNFDKSRDIIMKEPKSFAGPPGRMQAAEESYLDHHRSNLHYEPILDPSAISYNTFAPLPLMKDSPKPLLDKPRNMQTNQQKPPPRDNRQRDLREEMRRSPPRDNRRSPQKDLRDEMRRSPPREMRRSPQRNARHSSPPREARRPPPPRARGKESPHKGENATERIKRLEKLVEKLVEGKPSRDKPKDYGYHDSKELIPELIPSNSKFTTSMWLNCINEECLTQGYDEKSCIRFLQDQMTGIMKSWSKTVMDFNFTWPELKMLITKTFPDNVDFAQTLRLLTARDKSPEETITHYFFSKVYLCEACKITGENAVSCLIDGLNNPFIKQEIKTQNFLTPELLYSECLSKFPENEVPMRVAREVAGSMVEIEEDYGQENPYLQKEYSDSRPSGNVASKKCFTCNRFGHLTVDCRHAPICYICKKKGHIAKKCHYNGVSLIFGSSGARKIPKMSCAINGQGFDAVLDTGSVAVTLKQSIARKLSLILKPTDEVLVGFGGSIIKPTGEVEVQLEVDEVRRSVTALVVEDGVQEAPVIIGQEFLSREGVAFYQTEGQVRVMDEAA